ncbi:MAG: winged helix-turn-helix domain-containing protein, partial [Gammaproteobacteria bacterium]
MPLARKVFDLLLLLVESAGHLKTREELIEALWPRNIVEEQGLTTKLYALRRALGDDGEASRYVETVRGVGYRFIAPVATEEITTPADPLTQPNAAGRRSAPRARRAFERNRRSALVMTVAFAVIAGVLVWRLGPWETASRKLKSSSPSIAVLPFENLSADQSNAYFAAGIRDTILTRLAELGDLRVISRSASDAYATNPRNLTRVGRELNVGSVLEGSVQKAGKQVLINVQLIDTHTHAHIWAATYTRTLADIFKVEAEVASRVTAALHTRLRPAERARLSSPPTQDSEAYVLYLKANYNARRAFALANTPDPEAAVKQATSLYHQALARDPKFALAWAQLSLLDSKAWWFELDSTPARRAAAMQAAKRAIALAPALPQAHVALGYAWYYGANNYARALHQF